MQAPVSWRGRPLTHDRCIRELDAELHRNRNADALVRGYIFVYGEGTASPELLRTAHACARENDVPLHIHAGYLPEGADLYRTLTGKRHLVHLQELGFLDENTVVVHASALDADEETAVHETGCKIVWCPTAFFSLGITFSINFKMAERYRRGVCVSLGTDGARDCTPGETMLTAHHVAQSYADPLSPGALLEMQTLNAATAAGLEAELGSLEPGKRVRTLL